MAAAAGLTGYFVGGLEDPEPVRPQAAKPRPAAPALLPLASVYRSARADGARTAADRAYVRGRRDGQREGRRAAMRDVGARQRKIEQRGRRAALDELRSGVLYELCRGGTALCERSPAQRPASDPG